MTAKAKDKPSYEEMKSVLLSLGEFKYNTLKGVVEFNGKILDDMEEKILRKHLREAGCWSYLEAYKDAWSALAKEENSYHPMIEWLESLKWDGVHRIDDMCLYIKDKDIAMNRYLYKWMGKAVRKLLYNEQNMMLVLQGPQGIGKSYFCKWLMPKHEWFKEGAINPDNKDHHFMATEKLVWEVSELGSTTRRSDIDALKDFITKSYVSDRKPYGKVNVDIPTTASFIGTLNELTYLNDNTGERRFWTVEVTEIDKDYSFIVNPEQLWAEVYKVAKLNSKPFELTNDEVQMQEDINGRFKIPNAISEYLFDCFELTDDPNDFVSSTDIVKKLTDVGYKSSSTVFKELLSMLGRERQHKTKKSNGYRYIKYKINSVKTPLDD